MEATNSCSLDRKAQEERVSEIAALAARSLIEASPTTAGALVRLRPGAGVLAELGRLIEAESECCPFLRFRLSVDGDEVQLEVGGPPQARPLIDMLLAAREA